MNLFDRVINQHEIEIATSGSSESDKNNRFWMYIDMNEINLVVCLLNNDPGPHGNSFDAAVFS